MDKRKLLLVSIALLALGACANGETDTSLSTMESSYNSEQTSFESSATTNPTDSSSESEFEFSEEDLNNALNGISEGVTLQEYIFMRDPSWPDNYPDTQYQSTKKFTRNAYSSLDYYVLGDDLSLPQSETIYYADQDNLGNLSEITLGLDNKLIINQYDLSFHQSIFQNFLAELDPSYFTVTSSGYSLADFAYANYYMGYITGFTVTDALEIDDGEFYTRNFDINRLLFTTQDGQFNFIEFDATLYGSIVYSNNPEENDEFSYSFTAFYDVYDNNNTTVDLPTPVESDGEDKSDLEAAFNKLGHNYTANITFENTYSEGYTTYVEKYTEDAIYYQNDNMGLMRNGKGLKLFSLDGEQQIVEEETSEAVAQLSIDRYFQFPNISLDLIEKSSFDEYASQFTEDSYSAVEEEYGDCTFYVFKDDVTNQSSLLRSMFYAGYYYYTVIGETDYFELLFNFFFIIDAEGNLSIEFSTVQGEAYGSNGVYYAFPIVEITYDNIGTTTIEA